MRRLFAFALATVLSIGAAQAVRLDDRIRAGVLRVAAFDGNPPFGSVDPATRQIAGLVVDYAQAIADKLGVILEVRPTNPANRVPLITSGKVDPVLANVTITEERAKQIDFGIAYFASGQQFLAKKGTLSSPDQLNGLRVGADKGTTNAIVLRCDFPKASVVAFDDTPFAFTALRNGNVQAITQDGPKLVGLLAKVPDRQNYEMPALSGLTSAVLGLVLGIGPAMSTGTTRRALTLGLGFFRAVPIVMLIVWRYFLLTILLDVSVPEIGTVAAALSLVGGAYLSYGVAAGIEGVGRGHWEARADARVRPLAAPAPHRAAAGPAGHGAVRRQPVDRAHQGHVAGLRDRRARTVLRGRAGEQPGYGLPG